VDWVRKPELINQDVIYQGRMITVRRDTLRTEGGRELAEAVHQVYAGKITNGLAVAGLLAAASVRTSGSTGLRGPED